MDCPELAGKTAGFVTTFGGSLGSESQEFGTIVAQAFDTFVLKALGNQSFVFYGRTIYQEFSRLDVPASTISSQVYVYENG
jgi:hypothetical protein